MIQFCDNEKAWNDYSSRQPDYIEVPLGMNPYDYNDSCGLAQIFKFGYRQAKRGRPNEGLGDNATQDATEAFKRGYDAAAI